MVQKKSFHWFTFYIYFLYLLLQPTQIFTHCFELEILPYSRISLFGIIRAIESEYGCGKFERDKDKWSFE